MTDKLHPHKATSLQDARLPATDRRNIDDEPEVKKKRPEEDGTVEHAPQTSNEDK